MRMFSSRSCQTMANRTHETQSTHNNKQPKHRTASKYKSEIILRIFFLLRISVVVVLIDQWGKMRSFFLRV